uniref:Transmembrane protease serine 11G n=1 Tax=Bactrocera dorsalis TaxID=27457 RepID=A0A034V477_BACDO
MIEVKMISKLWLLICATHIVIIKGTYDPALNGIKTRNYHRTYPNAEQEPHINSQSYEPRPISNGNYGAGSVRLSPTNSYPHYDGSRTEQQPSHSHQHQHAVGQQQHQKQTAQQTASYQQRELPLFNRNAHVRHSTPTQRSERRESVLSSGLESTIPDFDTGCPPQHTGPVPYAYDCRRFVNCWHGRGHIQSCGPGTVFNPETLECDRPDKVVCGGALTNGERREQQATLHSAPQQNKYRAGRLIDASTDSVRDLCPNGFSGLAPHPNDCTKFLNCANGNTHVQNCGPGTAFSASKKVCDFKENVDCGDRENSAYGAVNNRDSRQYANLNYVDTNVQQNTLGRGEEKEEGDIFCPLGVSGHFPYPFDYTKFINCKNGNTAIQNCVPNTAYSISRNYCESKEKVPRTDHVAYIVSEVRYEYSLTIVSCPPSTDGLHLYPYDFTKYISCQQEHMNIVACGPKYVFSISRRECLPETQVNIADRVRNAWELRHNVESTDSRNAALNYMNELPECPQGHSSLYPYPFDCKKYLQCLDGKLSIETCDSGYVFSLSSKHCDPKDLVGNTEQVPLSFDVGQISTSESDYDYFNNNLVGIQLLCPQNVRGFFLYPFDCTKYGNTNIQSCAPNTFFSLSNKICIPSNEARDTDNLWLSTVGQVADNNFGTYHHNREWGTVDMTGAGTHTLSLEVCPSGASGLYPHPKDCTKYLRCANGITYVMDCGPGTAFNAALEVCDFKDKVDCSYNVDFNNVALGHDRGPSIHPITCPEGATGIYPHPLDCKKFLNCDNGITNIQDCGPGTAWNAKLETCDFIKNVDCSDTHNVHGNNPNANYQPPPTQSNYRDSTQNGWRQQHHEHGSSSQRTANDRQTYGNGVPTTSTQTGSYGDRWSNMDVQRPIASDMTYGGAYSADRQQRLPTHGRELQQHGSSNNWIASGSAIDRQTPTQSVIYEEGSLQPNREQHSLTTVPTQNSTHETRTEFYSKNTRQESKTNSNWHNHGHSREFHRKHPNLLDPFNEDDHTSTHTHHRHNHNRAYHQRHPEIPNPFITPETPQTTTNFELSNNNLPNPHAENTTPFSVRPRIDVRGEDINCQFDCGNGNCVKSHEVCNGINNCGNRKDEEDCKHLGYEVRLTGGESLNMGRIEVKVLGKWGYVCDDKFGLSDAEVVCRELGFKLGASEVRGFSYYPPTTVDVSFAMDEVECRGNETSLKECSFKGWGVSNCGPDEVVGVVCKVPQLKCPNNYWLCSTSQECIPPAFVCDNTPDCADKSDESETVCNSPIKYRLEGGRSPNEGRLEVRYRGEWGTVCDDDFGLKEARVMCNSMGFYGTPTIVKNKYGSGNGPIWLDQVSCYGNETTLDQCGHFTWGEHNCNHTEDVGLKCTLGAPPQKENSSPQLNDFENTQRELDDTQQQLEDIGLYSEQWERKSKAVGDQRRCGQFKNNLLDEFAHPEERVVNGSIAKRGHHPWQATIRTRGRGGISSHWCGAVLISSRHLLTAAHCLAGYPKGAYLVRMGDHYANIAESSEVDSFIENWYIHEKFRDGSHMNNDIAVIVLKTPVRFNDYIQPVCLPNKGAALAENRLCTISGWGSIKSGVSTPSNILRAAELPILSDEVCKQKHVYGASLTEGMFCAGYMDESSDACDGDSGGPLICHDEDGETLYGIISWGQHCGYANKPGVYVRVEKYVDWILEKINISIQNKL